MSELDVSTPGMRRGADGVASASDAVQTHVDAHQRDMADMSDIAGDDDLGSLIYACYQAIHDVAFGSYNDNNRALGDHAQRIGAMADTYDAGEQANTYEVNDVSKYL